MLMLCYRCLVFILDSSLEHEILKDEEKTTKAEEKQQTEEGKLHKYARMLHLC